jgi:mannose-6-phosphate isomerase-like protein (cupin superfamily)
MTTTGTTSTEASEVIRRRVIEPSQFVADQSAFIDVRLPRSEGKASYSFIGPGVTQNKDAFVNLGEPHGYCIGAASMLPGVVNNPHLHYTAEVFMCLSGEWRMDIGSPVEHSLVVRAGDVFSVPTWVFRSFENIGDHEGFLYTVLGEDDPGGIVWAPQILRAARETGLALNLDHEVVEVSPGNDWAGFVEPITDEQLRRIPRLTEEEVSSRVVRFADRAWTHDALLSSIGNPRGLDYVPVIGYGMSQKRDAIPPITYPHGFSLQWMRGAAGCTSGEHAMDASCVVIVMSGEWRIEMTNPVTGVTTSATPGVGAIVSVPRNWVRSFDVVVDGEILVVCDGDRSQVSWDEAVVRAARERGWVIDANGFIGDRDLVEINRR